MTLSPRQAALVRTALPVGSFFLVASIGLAGWAAIPNPNFKPLFQGLSKREEAKVIAALDASGFPSRSDGEGDVQVPEKRLRDAWLSVGSAGALPRSAMPQY